MKARESSEGLQCLEDLIKLHGSPLEYGSCKYYLKKKGFSIAQNTDWGVFPNLSDRHGSPSTVRALGIKKKLVPELIKKLAEIKQEIAEKEIAAAISDNKIKQEAKELVTKTPSFDENKFNDYEKKRIASEKKEADTQAKKDARSLKAFERKLAKKR
jgi:hypothetical protein